MSRRLSHVLEVTFPLEYRGSSISEFSYQNKTPQHQFSYVKLFVLDPEGVRPFLLLILYTFCYICYYHNILVSTTKNVNSHHYTGALFVRFKVYVTKARRCACFRKF